MRHHVWVTQLRTLDLVVDADSSDDAERHVRRRLQIAYNEPWLDNSTIIKVVELRESDRPQSERDDRPPRQLWSIPDAAERLGVGRSTVYGLLNDETLGSVRIGRRRFVAEEQLQRYVAERTNPHTTASEDV